MTLTLRISALEKSMGNEQFFQEATEQAASFNTRLKLERKMRLPFLDSQTGVAQSHTQLWHPYRSRQPGKYHGQIYSYPEKRWKKKKHYFLFSEEKPVKASDIETGESDMHQISTVENPAVRGGETEDFPELRSETSKDRWYDEYDEYMEPPDAGEMCDDQSDISDFEETFIKKKKRKPRGRKKKEDKEKEKIDEEKEKPYACEACSARYKTRPGLAYHYTHFHNGMIEPPEEPEPSPKPTPAKLEKILPVQYTTKQQQMAKMAPPQFGVQPLVKQQSEKREPEPAPEPESSRNERGEDGKVQSSDYCDFCLGDATENKKTGESEELVSCSDCGRSGHPTCLQFTDNMTVSVKKYPWQCIECKSCGLCGTSENDEQLLFCDDCDRGYHMYCLKPPLQEAPEGNWSCHLCIEEFHGGKKPAGMV